MTDLPQLYEIEKGFYILPTYLLTDQLMPDFAPEGQN